jgi:hypothetical protein
VNFQAVPPLWTEKAARPGSLIRERESGGVDKDTGEAVVRSTAREKSEIVGEVMPSLKIEFSELVGHVLNRDKPSNIDLRFNFERGEQRISEVTMRSGFTPSE